MCREFEYGSLPWRIGDALISYVVYLRQCFCPTGLALLYPRRGPVLPPWQVFGAGLVLLGITAAVWTWRRKRPYLLVGWLWYVGMLLLVIGLVPFGGQTAADRFTYLAADRTLHRGGVGGGRFVPLIGRIAAGCAVSARHWRWSL